MSRAAALLGLLAGMAVAMMAMLTLTAGPASAWSTKSPALQFPWPDNWAYRIAADGHGYNCVNHSGIEAYALDFGMGVGTAVHSVASGRAYHTSQAEGGLGIYIVHGNGFVSTYWHLSSWVADHGAYVNQGQLIAYSGQTGEWNGESPHLHFSVHQKGHDLWSGEPYKPEPMYGPYRGGDAGFHVYGDCAGGASPAYISKPGCPSGSSNTVFPRATTHGYWQVAQDGGVFAYGGAPFRGSMGGQRLNAVMTGIARTYDNQGYWTVGADGGVFNFNAPFNGSAGSINLVSCIQGMVARSNGGYWLVAADGGVFSYEAPFYGSMGGQPLAARVQAMTGRPQGDGYWMVGADGGVFAFGNAKFFGSLAGRTTAPAMSIAASPSGNGYWVLLADGTVVGFGDAANLGSAVNPYTVAVGITPTVNGDGYWVSLADGQVLSIGNAYDWGGMYGNINAPANGISGLHSRPGSFTMTALPSAVVVAPGTSNTSTITVTANPYFQGTVSLSVRGMPSGVTASLTPTSVSLNQHQSATSTLRVTRSVSSVGAFTLTVTGCGNNVCQFVPVTVS